MPPCSPFRASFPFPPCPRAFHRRPFLAFHLPPFLAFHRRPCLAFQPRHQRHREFRAFFCPSFLPPSSFRTFLEYLPRPPLPFPACQPFPLLHRERPKCLSEFHLRHHPDPPSWDAGHRATPERRSPR